MQLSKISAEPPQAQLKALVKGLFPHTFPSTLKKASASLLLKNELESYHRISKSKDLLQSPAAAY